MKHTTSWSQIDTARQCPLKYQLSYVERWEPAKTALPLARGTAWHSMLAAHYGAIQRAQLAGTRPNRSEVVDAAVGQLLEADVDEETRDLLEWMYAGYIDAYGLDDQWKVLAIEHRAVCALPTPTGRRSNLQLKMFIDLVVRDRSLATRKDPGGKIILVDHKTCKTLPTDRELDLDDQFGLYTWGMRQLGRPVFQNLHNACRTQRNKGPMALDARFLRTPSYRTDVELDTLAREAYQTQRAADREGREAAKYGVDMPRHTDPDKCRWRCPYVDPCLSGRKGVDMRQHLVDKGFTALETEEH